MPQLTEKSRILILGESSFDVASQNSNWLEEAEWQDVVPDTNGTEIILPPYATAFIKSGG